MTAQSHPAARTTTAELSYTRVFPAPAARVWQAWTDPDQIARIGQQTQIGQNVFDFFAVVKTGSADNAMGYIAQPKRLFEHSALRIGAVKNGNLFDVNTLPQLFFDAPGHPGGLFAFVTQRRQLQQLAASLVGPKAFWFTVRIVSYDFPGSVQNIGGAAVILL